jgi:hypothetical protein
MASNPTTLALLQLPPPGGGRRMMPDSLQPPTTLKLATPSLPRAALQATHIPHANRRRVRPISLARMAVACEQAENAVRNSCGAPKRLCGAPLANFNLHIPMKQSCLCTLPPAGNGFPERLPSICTAAAAAPGQDAQRDFPFPHKPRPPPKPESSLSTDFLLVWHHDFSVVS